VRRRFRAVCALALALGAARAPAQEDAWWREGPMPDGPAVLERMRAALPKELVEVRGSLVPRGEKAGETRPLDAVLVLDWRGDPARAEFELRDVRTGDIVAGFVSERPANGPASYRATDARGESRDVRPTELAADTAFTWADLAFDYLWWPKAVTAGVEMRRQRRCYLVDVPNPDPRAEEASVRLWVDDSVFALLQAETRAADGRVLRELSVKSLRRTGTQWSVEDIEVKDLRNGRRTVLRIRPPEGA
jgi:hypothetical protein